MRRSKTHKRLALAALLFGILIVVLAGCPNGLDPDGPGNGTDPVSVLIVIVSDTELGTDGVLDFGSVVLGNNKQVSATIENRGDAALTLLGDPPVALSGTHASQFSVTVEPDVSVAPGTSTTATLRFSPTSVGTKTATLTVLSNDPLLPKVELDVVGVCLAVPEGEIQLSYSSTIILNNGSHTFPGTDEGTTSERIFTITNTGTADLVLTGTPMVSATPDEVFSVISQPAHSTISAGNSEAFTVKFSPPGHALYEATLSIASNAVNHPAFSITAGGTGIQTQTGVPGSLSATDGSSISYVELSWSQVTEATSYYIYRSTSDTPPGTQTYTTSSTTYNDTGATPGVLYYYWVRAYCAEFLPDGALSDYSASDTGYRNLGTSASVTAADGTTTTDIIVSWSAITGADSYELFRNTENSSPGPSQLATMTVPTGTSLTDLTVTAGRYYYYWVRGVAESSDTTGAWSTETDSGYKMMEAPVVTRCSQDDTWQEVYFEYVEGATQYRIYCSDDFVANYPNETYQPYGSTYTTTTSPYADWTYWAPMYTPYLFGVRAYSSYIDQESEMHIDVPYPLFYLSPNYGYRYNPG